MPADPLAWLKSPEGWDALNQTAPTEGEAQADMRGLLAEFEVCKLFYEVFATGRGPELLQHLEQMLFFTPLYTINGAIAFNELQISLSPSEWAMIRTGQNSVLHHIRAMMVKAVDGPPAMETRHDNSESEDQRSG